MVNVVNVFCRKVRNDKMFSNVSRTFNPIVVLNCGHACKYCWWLHRYSKRYMSRFNLKRKSYFFRERLKQIKKFKRGELVFVGDLGDMFWEKIPNEWIREVLKVLVERDDVVFLLLTKNPERYFEFDEFKDAENIIWGATIETDLDDLYIKYRISQAPLPSQRIKSMMKLKRRWKFISVEPVLKFSRTFGETLVKIKPIGVAVGYDNYGFNLPEPSIEEVIGLIEFLRRRGVHVIEKNLRRF